VCSPLGRVDAVGEGKDVFRVGVVVLERHLDQAVIFRTGDKDRIFMKDLLVAVDVLHKGDDPPFVKELALAIDSLVDQGDLDPGIQKGQLAQAVREDVVAELRLLENRIVRLEGDRGPPALGLADLLQGGIRNAADVGLRIHAAVASDLQIQRNGKRVHHGDADAVETAGYLITVVGKLGPGMEPRKRHFRRRNPLRLMHVHRYAAPVVFDQHAVIHPDLDDNRIAKTGGRLINAVVHHLVDQMMEAIFPGRPDIHGRTLPDRLQTFQHLDAVGSVTLRRTFSFVFLLDFHLTSFPFP